MAHAEIDAGAHADQQDREGKNHRKILLPGVSSEFIDQGTDAAGGENQETDRRRDCENAATPMRARAARVSAGLL
jgi:hypothetical protein